MTYITMVQHLLQQGFPNGVLRFFFFPSTKQACGANGSKSHHSRSAAIRTSLDLTCLRPQSVNEQHDSSGRRDPHALCSISSCCYSYLTSITREASVRMEREDQELLASNETNKFVQC